MSKMAEAFYGDTPAPYPAGPGFKTGGTSRESAARIAPRVDTLRDQVLAAVVAAGARGLTADEAAEQLGKTPFAIRPRLTELGPKYLKKVRPSGQRRKNASGHSAVVWVAGGTP